MTLRASFSCILSFSQIFKYSLRSNMIKIRLQRHGARHAPFYRMVVTPSETRRDGRYIEVLGTYNPQSSARERELDLKMDRIDHWLDVGAQPTDTAKSLIRQGRLSPEEWLKRTEAKSAAKTARISKKKTPAPVAEAPVKEEAKAEEAPAEEAKEEPKAEEPVAEAEEAKEEAVKEEAKAEEAPAKEAKEEPKAEEPVAEAEEAKEEAVKEEAKAEEAPAKEAKEEASKAEEAKAAEASAKGEENQGRTRFKGRA